MPSSRVSPSLAFWPSVLIPFSSPRPWKKNKKKNTLMFSFSSYILYIALLPFSLAFWYSASCIVLDTTTLDEHWEDHDCQCVSHHVHYFWIDNLNATSETNYTTALTEKVVFFSDLSEPLPSASGQTHLSYVLFFRFSSFFSRLNFWKLNYCGRN